jgi:hypothetical protein
MANKYKPNTGLFAVNDRKEKETHPDYTGKIYVDKPGLYYLKGWKKAFADDRPYLSVAADYAPEDKQAEARESHASAPTPVTSDASPF